MDYEATGSVKFGGCASYKFTIFISSYYNIGDIVFEKKKAQRGILRRHCIKQVQVDSVQDTPRYVDTFNAFFRQDELISYDDAIVLIRTAISQAEEELENHVINCT